MVACIPCVGGWACRKYSNERNIDISTSLFMVVLYIIISYPLRINKELRVALTFYVVISKKKRIIGLESSHALRIESVAMRIFPISGVYSAIALGDILGNIFL